MNIAVSGANGSIAKELIPFLQKLGCHIIRISSSLKSDGKTTFSYEDLLSHSINKSVDIFIHLASFNSNLGESNFNDEISLSKDVLRSMKSLNCKKLIFFSTCKVYGEPSMNLDNIFKENESLNPSSLYGKAKLECEKLIQSESEKSQIKSIILRLSPVLNVNASSSLGILMTLSRKIPIFSLIIGEQNKRTFLSINNLFAAIAKIIQSIDFSKPNKIYNLSDSSSISLNHLLRIYSQKRIYVLPSFISKIFFSIPFLNNFLCRLYGNFEVSNELIQKDLGINLHTTEQSLPIISK